MKKTRFGAIDVGTTKVCTIIADNGGSTGSRILGVGIVPSHGMHKGMVVNVNEAKETIRESVRKAEQVAGFKLESACVGVTGRHISSTNTQGAIAITRRDQLVRKEDLKRVLDVARSIKIPSEHKLLHAIPRTFKVDGQDGIKNPVGMHGFRVDVETHLITAAVTSIQNLTKCIRSVGVDIEDLVLEPLASAEAVLSDDEKQDGVMLADIGGGTTDLALFKDSTIYHTSVLPVAGYQFTRDVAIGLGLSFELAEEMKRRYGDVAIDNNNNNVDDRTLNGDGHGVSYNSLSEILRMRAEELLRLIVLELPQKDYLKLIPSGLVLTGGGANLVNITGLAEAVTHLPVRIGVPKRFDGVSDSLQDPAYSTAVGLLLWQLKNRVKEDRQIKESGLHRFVARIIKLFG